MSIFAYGLQYLECWHKNGKRCNGIIIVAVTFVSQSNGSNKFAEFIQFPFLFNFVAEMNWFVIDMDRFKLQQAIGNSVAKVA